MKAVYQEATPYELGDLVTHPDYAAGQAIGVVVVACGPANRVKVCWAGEILTWYDGYRGDVMPLKCRKNVTHTPIRALEQHTP